MFCIHVYIAHTLTIKNIQCAVHTSHLSEVFHSLNFDPVLLPNTLCVCYRRWHILLLPLHIILVPQSITITGNH